MSSFSAGGSIAVVNFNFNLNCTPSLTYAYVA
jgi:hypothetical protein